MFVGYLLLSRAVSGVLPSTLMESPGMIPEESAEAVRRAKRIPPLARLSQWVLSRSITYALCGGADGAMLLLGRFQRGSSAGRFGCPSARQMWLSSMAAPKSLGILAWLRCPGRA